MQDFDQTIRLDPGNARAFLARGATFDYKGLPDRAI